MHVVLTEESEQLEPTDLLLAAVALLAAVSRQVSEVVELKQVDDCDVNQLLRAEGFLQDQPLHSHTETDRQRSRVIEQPITYMKNQAELMLVAWLYLKLLLQFLPQTVQFVQTLTQVDMAVKFDESLDEI